MSRQVTVLHVLARRTRFQIERLAVGGFSVVDTRSQSDIGKKWGYRSCASDAAKLALRLERGG